MCIFLALTLLRFMQLGPDLLFVMDRCVRHEFLPQECLLKRAVEFIPIVRKYQLELTCPNRSTNRRC